MDRPVLRTKLCELLGIEYPVVLAGMGPVASLDGASTPELAAAVSNAGGLGVLGAAALSPDELNEWIERTRRLTVKPFGVDTLLPSLAPASGGAIDLGAELPEAHLEFAREFRRRHGLPEAAVERPAGRGRILARDFFRRQLEVVLDQRVPVYVAGLGDPGVIVKEAHARGMVVMAIAGAVKHARRFVESGVDAVVAQGTEAGGHTGRIGTMVLVPQVVDAVEPRPVLAAGGIADGRGVAAALALGASGVWCGTPFLATVEAGIDDFQKQALVEANSDDTVVSRSYTGKPVRMLANKWAQEFDASGLKPLALPFQGFVSMPVLYAARRARRADIVPGIAGQSAGVIRRIRPAAEVVEQMVREAAELLARGLPARVRAQP
ncbi:MAG: nitronate monooxygenase [Deltaproteobacteria bacterium]|jgi:NAD(P)H-dependent flavin oxidoreductase YrpB (nitropropane dioxygenase family)|nr:nitronate monooxygenase [Deltaproteobacteria bacterium]